MKTFFTSIIVVGCTMMGWMIQTRPVAPPRTFDPKVYRFDEQNKLQREKSLTRIPIYEDVAARLMQSITIAARMRNFTDLEEYCQKLGIVIADISMDVSDIVKIRTNARKRVLRQFEINLRRHGLALNGYIRALPYTAREKPSQVWEKMEDVRRVLFNFIHQDPFASGQTGITESPPSEKKNEDDENKNTIPPEEKREEHSFSGSRTQSQTHHHGPCAFIEQQKSDTDLQSVDTFFLPEEVREIRNADGLSEKTKVYLQSLDRRLAVLDKRYGLKGGAAERHSPKTEPWIATMDAWTDTKLISSYSSGMRELLSRMEVAFLNDSPRQNLNSLNTLESWSKKFRKLFLLIQPVVQIDPEDPEALPYAQALTEKALMGAQKGIRALDRIH